MHSIPIRSRDVAAALTVLVMVSFSSVTAFGQANEESRPRRTLEDSLQQAGDNRAELEKALDASPPEERPGMEFLITHMPERDLTSLTSEFLREHVSYGYKAWNESAWKDQVPEEIFMNEILPYASINERRDRWRADFYQRFSPLVADAKTPGEAAVKLNQQIFQMVNVKYSTKRPKADQSPYESIEASLASCTGLSILLIDACRAVGVPARFVGTPRWADNSGNHSWVEVWDNNGWHFTGAAEPSGDDLDKGWFVNRAARAKRDERRYAIYAVSYKDTPLRFPLLWERNSDYVRAVNVTDRYKGLNDELPPDHARVLFRVLNLETHDRCAVNFRVLDDSGKVIYQGQTKDERFDANDHISVPLRKNAKFQVEVIDGENVLRNPIETGAEQQLITLTVNDDAAAETANAPAATANSERESRDDQTSSERSSESSSESSGSDSSSAVIEQLKSYLATSPKERGDVDALSFAHVPLSKSDSEQASELLWKDHSEQIRKTRTQEIEDRKIVFDGKEMKFEFTTFGEAPENGRSLYISMHGGGNAPPRVNDRQWENQKGLYKLEEGIYLSPRAPTDTWNLWHEAHIDPMFDRLIEDLIVLENVDPNRVYIMGYSAGGDGVYQLAPRMADRLAAAAMMAGHPNETSPLGLRNLPFTLHMGGDDRAYKRNEVAAEWKEKLAKLQAGDPNGYVHWVELHEGMGHWMNRQDAAALPWMAEHTRNPLPSKIVWKQDDVVHQRFYWLAVDPGSAKARAEVTATRNGQQIAIETDDAEVASTLRIRLNDQMVNLDEPVRVAINDATVFEGKVPRTIATLARTLTERGDPVSVFSAEIAASEVENK